MQVAWCSIILAALTAPRSFAALQLGDQCQRGWKWLGQSCEEGINCILLGDKAQGLCLDFNCTKTVAPETLLPSPTTVIVDTITTALQVTVTRDESCQCWPTVFYTTTITATPPPYYQSHYPWIGDCTIYPNGVCWEDASCLTLPPDYQQNPMCATANCLDTAAPMTTKYWPSTTYEGRPGATTFTVTNTATRLVRPTTTPSTTCTCIQGPSPTTTRTYYVSPTPAP